MWVLSLAPFQNHTIWPAGALDIVLVMKKLSRHLEKLKAILIMVSFLPFRWQVLLRSGTVMIPFPELAKIYENRRDVLCSGLERIGWDIERPKAGMFVWAKIPEPFNKMGSMEFAHPAE